MRGDLPSPSEWGEEGKICPPILRADSIIASNSENVVDSKPNHDLGDQIQCGVTNDCLYSMVGGGGKPTREEASKKKINQKKMANVGIEPKTFALLARRSNQLS